MIKGQTNFGSFKKGHLTWNKGIKGKLSHAFGHKPYYVAKGENHWAFGTHPSKQTLIKLSESHKGYKMPEEQKRKMKLYRHTEEAKKKIRDFCNNPKVKAMMKLRRTKQIMPAIDTSIEIKIQNYLKQLGITFFTHQYIKEIEHGYQCDILIPSMNLVIECDGDYWHKYPIGREIDYVRTKELIEKGFKVLRLWEHEIKKMDINSFEERMRQY
jgi:very-short-patch-repair endonuclease